jgi:pimeloyl-ACP methyl ester carboxylesterase
MQRTLRLPDGRRLAFAAWGDPAGAPVLYFHGLVGVPLARCPRMDAALERHRMRLLLPQRPGFGGSDPLPGRRLSDWPRDVLAVADALGLGRFAILAVSAGGPYAAACVQALGHRVRAAAIVGGTVPLWGPDGARPANAAQRLGRLAGRAPRPWAAALAPLAAGARRHPERVLALAAACASPADRRHLAGPQRRATIAAFRAATARGAAPVAEDCRVALGPWGFAPEEVTGPVRWFHGAADPLVPATQAAAIAARMPRCELTLLAGDGHFCLREHASVVLGALAGERALRAAA